MYGGPSSDGSYSVFKGGEWDFTRYSLRVNHDNRMLDSIEQEEEERSSWIADQAAREEGLTEREADRLRRRKRAGVGNVASSYRGTTAHEFGHALQQQYGLIEVGLRLTYNKVMQDLFDELGEEQISMGLSEYAATDPGEMMSEAFTEMQRPDARPLARRVYDLMMKEASR